MYIKSYIFYSYKVVETNKKNKLIKIKNIDKLLWLYLVLT